MAAGTVPAIGVLTVLAAFGRSAVVFNRIAAVGWFIVTAVCIAATAASTGRGGMRRRWAR